MSPLNSACGGRKSLGIGQEETMKAVCDYIDY